MTQIITKFIANDAVDDTKVKLRNAMFMRARNQANTADVNLFKLNTSDRIEFASIPQYPASNPSPTAATDIASKAYVDQQVASHTNFYRNPVVVNDAVSLTKPTANPVDGQTINTGDRVLFTNLSANNNEVWVATNTAGTLSWVVAIDNDPAGLPLTGDTLWVKSGTYTKHQLTYNGTAWVVTGTDVNVESGDSITVTSLGRLNISLMANGGLVSSSPGNPGGTLGIQLQTSNATLFIDGSNHLGVRFSNTTSGLQAVTAGLAIQLEAVNPSLQIDGSNELGVKFNPGGAIITGSSGIGVQLQASNPTLAIGSNQLGVKFSTTTSGLQATGAGLALQLQASNPTLAIDGSNQLGVKYSATAGLTAVAGGLSVLVDSTGDATIQIDSGTGEIRTPREKFEVIVLSGADITNQYKDLTRLSQLNSVEVIVAGVEQTSGVDYTLSTVGGVTRVTFAGDLATGGNAALISGDTLYVRYRSYTA